MTTELNTALVNTFTTALTDTATNVLSKVTNGELLGALKVTEGSDLKQTVTTVIESQLKTGADVSNAVNKATLDILNAVGTAIGAEVQASEASVAEAPSTTETVDEDNPKTIKIEINQ